MIIEDYVSFEMAKLLKEKGFDCECSCYYFFKDKEQFEESLTHWNWNGGFTFRYSAPTLQMAIKWLREVHNLHISVEMGFDVDNHQYYFFVPSICKFSSKTGEYQTPFGEKEFDTYEEACELAIKYCLENLI